MRRFVTVAAGLISIIGFARAALAADLSVKAPTAAPVPFSWTGCYAGGHLAGVVSQDKTTSILGTSNSFGSAGFVSGGQIGCDYQFASNWVIGVEGMAAWSSLKNTHTAAVRFPGLGGVIVPSQFTLRNDFLSSATARLGYGFADRWLVFVKGGAAWTHEKIDDAFIFPFFGPAVDPNASMIRTGWTAGAGVDWAFASHWSANLEYDYYDFGNAGALLTGPVTGVSVNSLKDKIHTVTVGVNYHF